MTAVAAGQPPAPAPPIGLAADPEHADRLPVPAAGPRS